MKFFFVIVLAIATASADETNQPLSTISTLSDDFLQPNDSAQSSASSQLNTSSPSNASSLSAPTLASPSMTPLMPALEPDSVWTSSAGSSVDAGETSMDWDVTDSEVNNTFNLTASNSADNVEVGDSMSGSSGSEDFDIKFDKILDEDFNRSNFDFNEAENAAAESTEGSSSTASTQKLALYASATIAVAIGVLI